MKALWSLVTIALALSSGLDAAPQDMIGTTFNGDVYDIDSVTGESSFLGNCGFTFIGSQARSFSGTVYAISRPGNLTNHLIQIDANGNGTMIGPVQIGASVQSLAYDDVGDSLLAFTAGELFKIDPATGDTGLVGPTVFTLPGAATFEPGGPLYVWESSFVPGTRGLYTVDQNSGASNHVSLETRALSWISHDNNGVLLGGGGPEAIFVIDGGGQARFDSGHSADDVVNANFVTQRAPFTQACMGSGGSAGTCTDCPCGNNASFLTVGGCLNSGGASARLLPRGGASISNGNLRFDLTEAARNSFGMLLSGASIAPTSPFNPCFGDNSGVQSPGFAGLRCAVQDLRRHGSRMIDASGRVGFQNNGWGPPSQPSNGIANQAGFTNGQTRHFQVFYRDLQHGSCTSEVNTTQVVTTTFTP